MQYKLDWFAFTFPIALVGEGDNQHTLSQILLAFHDHTAHRFLGVVTNALWTWQPISGFYSSKIQCPKTLITIAWKGDNHHALCELSGQSCDLVTKSLSPRHLALAANGRCTRIDCAVDIETDCSPKAFAEAREPGRFASTSHIISESGETYYVGSRSGERMARVYRYAYPHPRHMLLRIEAEYKGDFAKALCSQMTEVSLTNLSEMAHKPFGWRHPVWEPEKLIASTLKGRRTKTEAANTLRWLNLTVAPAILKAAKDGLISLTEWIDEFLHPSSPSD